MSHSTPPSISDDQAPPRADSPTTSDPSTLAGAPDNNDEQPKQQQDPVNAAGAHEKTEHENVLLDNEKGLVPGHVSDEYPDGGLRAWSVVLGAWCVSFTTWGVTNSYGVFQTHYQANQLSHKTSSDITWIGSFQLSMVLACATLSGALFDAGYIKYLLCGGTLLYAAGLFGLSFTESYAEIFVAQGIACGVACGIVFLPAVSSVSHFFKRRRATALGILATGSSLGGVVYPILLNRTFNSIGFGWGVRAAGFLTVGLLCISCLTVTTRLPKRKGAFTQFSAYKDPAFSLYVLGAAFVILGLYTPFYFIESYSISQGVDPDLAFYSLSILNAASLFGRIIPNYLADTYGPLTILLPNCVLSGILIFVWLPLAKSVPGMVVFALMFGFTSGAYVSTMPACVAVLTEDMTQIGVRISMAFLGISVAALVGSPIAGAIIASQGGTYQGAAIFGGVVVLVGSVIVGLGRQVMVRRKGTQWV